MVASTIFYNVVCWGSGLRVANTSRVNKLIHKTGSVLDVELDSLHVVRERGMLSKLLSNMGNVSYPLRNVLVNKRSMLSWRRLSFLWLSSFTNPSLTVVRS